MPGWWDDLIADTKRNLQVGTANIEEVARKADEELEAQRGIGPAVLRGFVKVGRLFVRLVVGGIAELFPGLAVSFDTVFTGKVMDVPQESWDISIEQIARGFQLDQASINILKSYCQGLEGCSPVVQGLSKILLFTSIVQFLMGPGMGKLNQTLMDKFRPIAPAPGDVMGARGLDPELDNRIWRILERNGYRESDIEAMFGATYQRLPPNVIREIFYREGKTKEWAAHRMYEQGFTPERIDEFLSVWPVIPGIQDLIMMQAKEAFEPELISKYGLGAEEPTDIYEWTRKLGLSDEWTQRYWSSHWQHASYAQVMEMLHRGYISEDAVYDWYRLVEIPPYWRDLLTKIAYSPYTRVDVRRMHAAGVIGDEELVQAMKDIGYDQEHAEKMAEFYKKYNTASGKELSRADIEKAYEDRDLTYTQAISLLVAIGYDEGLADFYLSRIELEMQRAVRLERIDLTKEKFLSSLVTESEARNLLVGTGVEIARINELLDRWRVQVIKNAKLPSKTDLDKFVRAEVIGEDGYRIEMAKLGYSTYYINLYWKYLTAGGAVE